MKILILLAFLMTGVSSAEDNSELMPIRYLPNDGTAMPGNPGVFPSRERPEVQAQEAEEEDKVLDMSTAPDDSKIKRTLKKSEEKE